MASEFFKNFYRNINRSEKLQALPIIVLEQFCFVISKSETPEVEGQGGNVPPQVLGYQLTLFGPRRQIMPAILQQPPPSFWSMRLL